MRMYDDCSDLRRLEDGLADGQRLYAIAPLGDTRRMLYAVRDACQDIDDFDLDLRDELLRRYGDDRFARTDVTGLYSSAGSGVATVYSKTNGYGQACYGLEPDDGHGGDVMCRLRLPDGWSVKLSDDMTCRVYDADDNVGFIGRAGNGHWYIDPSTYEPKIWIRMVR